MFEKPNTTFPATLGDGDQHTRRDLLQIAMFGGLASVLGMTAGCSSQSNSPRMPATEHTLEAIIAPFRERYLADGVIPAEMPVNELLLQTEHLRFIEADGKASSDFQRFDADVYQPFKNQVGTRFHELLRDAPADSERLALLKQAMFESLGDTVVYNKTNNSVLDPLVNSKVQCRSATQLFLLLAREFERDVLLEGEELVVIYTDTHELAGRVQQGRFLVGYEMTTRGIGRVDFGVMTESDVPMRVCRSEHVAAQAIFATCVHQDKVVIHNSLGELSEATIHQKAIGSELEGPHSGRISANEHFAYSSGKIDVPEGNRDLTDQRFFSTSSYKSNRVPVPQGIGEAGNSLSLDILPAAERKKVVRYLQHNQYFGECWIRHADIINSDKISDREKLRQLGALVDEMRTYWDRNALSEHRDQAATVLIRRRLAPAIEPANIYNRIRHNLTVIEKRTRS